jgi:hypothetical protein
VKSLPEDLHNALDCALVESHGTELPFGVEEVIDSLRRERYTAHFREEGRAFNRVVRKTYYFIRPLVSSSVRRNHQKTHLWGWVRIPFPAWPVGATVDRIHQKLLALSLTTQGLEGVPFIWVRPEGSSICTIMTHGEEVRVHLKQPFPFIMVDRALELEPGSRIKTLNKVAGNEIQFLGHFPEFAVTLGDVYHRSPRAKCFSPVELRWQRY